MNSFIWKGTSHTSYLQCSVVQSRGSRVGNRGHWNQFEATRPCLGFCALCILSLYSVFVEFVLKRTVQTIFHFIVLKMSKMQVLETERKTIKHRKHSTKQASKYQPTQQLTNQQPSNQPTTIQPTNQPSKYHPTN